MKPNAIVQIPRPMLAARLSPSDIPRLKFPLLASPKIDGVRATVHDATVYSRSGKPIPSRHVQHLFGHPDLNNFDGELVYGNPQAKDCYNKTVSAVMSHNANIDPTLLKFIIFDKQARGAYTERSPHALNGLKNVHPNITLLQQTPVNSTAELSRVCADHLYLGYEGTMLRSPSAPYKFGRSTLREQALVKVKTFLDSEAVVLACHELYHNANEPFLDELGYTKHTTHEHNQVPMNMLGSLTVRDIHSGVEFDIGSGFTRDQRIAFWNASLNSTIIKYKYFPHGVKDKPRHPIFLGFRDPLDLTPNKEQHYV